MRGARKDSKDEGKGEAVAEGRASACQRRAGHKAPSQTSPRSRSGVKLGSVRVAVRKAELRVRNRVGCAYVSAVLAVKIQHLDLYGMAYAEICNSS